MLSCFSTLNHPNHHYTIATTNDLAFEHCESDFRYIIHECAEDIDLVSRSEGDSSEERFVHVYKPGFEPPEEEEDVQQPTFSKNLLRNKRKKKILVEAPEEMGEIEVLGTKLKDRRTIEELEHEMVQSKRAKLVE